MATRDEAKGWDEAYLFLAQQLASTDPFGLDPLGVLKAVGGWSVWGVRGGGEVGVAVAVAREGPRDGSGGAAWSGESLTF